MQKLFLGALCPRICDVLQIRKNETSFVFFFAGGRVTSLPPTPAPHPPRKGTLGGPVCCRCPKHAFWLGQGRQAVRAFEPVSSRCDARNASLIHPSIHSSPPWRPSLLSSPLSTILPKPKRAHCLCTNVHYSFADV